MQRPDETTHLADAAVSQCIRALALVASRSAFEQARQQLGRDGVQRHLDEQLAHTLEAIRHHLEAGGDVDPRITEQAVPLLERLRGMVRNWPFGTPPAPMLVDCARAALTALGISPPASWEDLTIPTSSEED